MAKQVAFVCGHYRGNFHNEVHQNIERARQAACELWKRGYIHVCQQLNSAWMSGVVEESVFLEGYLELILRCDVLAVMKYAISEGVDAEIAAANKAGLEVLYL